MAVAARLRQAARAVLLPRRAVSWAGGRTASSAAGRRLALGIECTFDDTAAAVVSSARDVLSDVRFTQDHMWLHLALLSPPAPGSDRHATALQRHTLLKSYSATALQRYSATALNSGGEEEDTSLVNGPSAFGWTAGQAE